MPPPPPWLVLTALHSWVNVSGGRGGVSLWGLKFDPTTFSVLQLRKSLQSGRGSHAHSAQIPSLLLADRCVARDAFPASALKRSRNGLGGDSARRSSGEQHTGPAADTPPRPPGRLPALGPAMWTGNGSFCLILGAAFVPTRRLGPCWRLVFAPAAPAWPAHIRPSFLSDVLGTRGAPHLLLLVGASLLLLPASGVRAEARQLAGEFTFLLWKRLRCFFIFSFLHWVCGGRQRNKPKDLLLPAQSQQMFPNPSSRCSELDMEIQRSRASKIQKSRELLDLWGPRTSELKSSSGLLKNF